EFIVPPCGKLDWSPAAKAAGRKTNRRAGQCSEPLQCLAPLHPSCLAEAAGLLRQRPYSLPLGQGQSGPVTSSCTQDSPQGPPFPAQQTQEGFPERDTRRPSPSGSQQWVRARTPPKA